MYVSTHLWPLIGKWPPAPYLYKYGYSTVRLWVFPPKVLFFFFFVGTSLAPGSFSLLQPAMHTHSGAILRPFWHNRHYCTSLGSKNDPPKGNFCCFSQVLIGGLKRQSFDNNRYEHRRNTGSVAVPAAITEPQGCIVPSRVASRHLAAG